MYPSNTLLFFATQCCCWQSESVEMRTNRASRTPRVCCVAIKYKTLVIYHINHHGCCMEALTSEEVILKLGEIITTMVIIKLRLQ